MASLGGREPGRAGQDGAPAASSQHEGCVAAMGGARTSLGKRYAADCGTKDNKFLSRAAAVATRRYYRPG